jgi:quinolinate synthase
MTNIQDKDKKYIESLKKKIQRLKKQRNAVIIVHNYQRDEIQEIADISGDSLALSKAAVRTDADVIVFCGVYFMAETAAILNPNKVVLLPVLEAGCPLADMVNPEKLRAKRKEYPEAAVVCYVNSSAAVKAESDICCTSSNAIDVVKALPHKQIIFIPDKNLGRYVQANVPQKRILLWDGFCPTHIRLQEQEVLEAKRQHPAAEFIAHPECQPQVLALADHICSTGGMFTYAKNSKAKEFIIGTESGMLYKLRKDNPSKKFFMPTTHLVCPSMKLITLGWVAHSLEANEHIIKVSPDIAEKALSSIKKMLQVSDEKPVAALAGY